MYMLRPKSYLGPLVNEESSLQFVRNGKRLNYNEMCTRHKFAPQICC